MSFHECSTSDTNKMTRLKLCTLHTTYLSQVDMNTSMANAFHLKAFEERKWKKWYLLFYVNRVAKQATETCNCLVNKNMNYTRLIRLHWRFAYKRTMYVYFLYCVYSIEFNLDEKRKKALHGKIHNLKSNRYSGSVQLCTAAVCFCKLRRTGRKIDITKYTEKTSNKKMELHNSEIQFGEVWTFYSACCVITNNTMKNVHSRWSHSSHNTFFH